MSEPSSADMASSRFVQPEPAVETSVRPMRKRMLLREVIAMVAWTFMGRLADFPNARIQWAGIILSLIAMFFLGRKIEASGKLYQSL